jgi:hypothetical protein
MNLEQQLAVVNAFCDLVDDYDCNVSKAAQEALNHASPLSDPAPQMALNHASPLSDPAPAPDNTLTLADSCPDIVIKKVRGLGSLPQGAVVVTASEWWCWNDNERRVEEQECQIKKLNKEIAALKEKNSENMEWEKKVILLNVDKEQAFEKDQAFEKGYKSGLRVGLDYAAPHTHCDGCGRQYRYVA